MQPRQPTRPAAPSNRPTNVDRAFGGQAPRTPAPQAPPTTQQAGSTDTRGLFRQAQQKISGTREDGSSRWVNAELKQSWLDNLTPLYLHKLVYKANGKFGAGWVLHLSEDDPNGPVWFATFKSNDYRDQLFPELETAIESSGQPLGPLMLTVRQVEGQTNPAWDIQPWDDGAGIPF